LVLHVAELNLPDHLAHVGQARRLLMDAAGQRLMSVAGFRGVIATTDADTVVSPTWLSAILSEIEQGADVVGGRILIHPEDLQTMEPGARSLHLRDVGYRFLVSLLESQIDPPPGDPWPRHFQHFGASVALTTRAYLRSGGLPVRPSLEDVALYDRMVQIDARIRHSPDVRVFTSARPHGRTDFGFAVQLQRWSEMQHSGQPFYVRSADEIVNELRLRRSVRSAWRLISEGERPDELPLTMLARTIGVTPTFIADVLMNARPFGAVWRSIQDEQKRANSGDSRFPAVDIDQAIRDLRVRTSAVWQPRQTSGALEDIEPVAFLPMVGKMA
jgi:hypothetical protein